MYSKIECLLLLYSVSPNIALHLDPSIPAKNATNRAKVQAILIHLHTFFIHSPLLNSHHQNISKKITLNFFYLWAFLQVMDFNHKPTFSQLIEEEACFFALSVITDFFVYFLSFFYFWSSNFSSIFIHQPIFHNVLPFILIWILHLFDFVYAFIPLVVFCWIFLSFFV